MSCIFEREFDLTALFGLYASRLLAYRISPRCLEDWDRVYVAREKENNCGIVELNVVLKSDQNITGSEDAQRQLAKCVLFRGLNAHDRDSLLARTRTRTFSDGECIFQMGSPGTTLMAVLTGSVSISVTSPEGKQLVLATLEAGDIFGEIAVLDGRERTADATAVGRCSLAVLERRDILAFLTQQPLVWLPLVEVLCDRLRHADELLGEIALFQVPTRLAKTLIRVAKSKAKLQTPDSASMQVRLSQQELANLVGATRESVNKCLAGWQRAGIIHIDGRSINIKDQASLMRLAELGSK